MISYKLVIMMATYNGAKFIDEQLESICAQKYNEETLLMVRDDGSSDKTIDIINNWKSKLNIELVEDDEKLGPAKSFWKMFELAPHADFYAFVDQDDAWMPDKIEKAIETIENSKTEDNRILWFSNCKLMDAGSKIIKDKMHEIPPILSFQSELVCGIAQGCAMVFTSELREYILNKTITQIPMHDQVVLEYAFLSGKVIYEDETYFMYRVHTNNVVAKEGKSFWGKIKTTYKSWFVHKNETSGLAKELLNNNHDILNESDAQYLKLLSGAPRNFFYRIRLIRHSSTVSSDRRGLRSFKIRTLIGVI